MKTPVSRRGIFASLLALVGMIPAVVQAKPVLKVPKYRRVQYKLLHDEVVAPGDFWILEKKDPNEYGFNQWSQPLEAALGRTFGCDRAAKYPFVAKDRSGAGQYWRPIGVIDVFEEEHVYTSGDQPKPKYLRPTYRQMDTDELIDEGTIWTPSYITDLNKDRDPDFYRDHHPIDRGLRVKDIGCGKFWKLTGVTPVY